MVTGLSCMKRSDAPQAVHADSAAMTFQRCQGIMEGHVVGKHKGVEAMATEKHINIQIIIILHDTDTTLIIPRPSRIKP